MSSNLISETQTADFARLLLLKWTFLHCGVLWTPLSFEGENDTTKYERWIKKDSTQEKCLTAAKQIAGKWWYFKGKGSQILPFTNVDFYTCITKQDHFVNDFDMLLSILRLVKNIVNISQAQNCVKMKGAFRFYTPAFSVGLITDLNKSQTLGPSSTCKVVKTDSYIVMDLHLWGKGESSSGYS